eukprot:TRINITY_DN20103_c0_g1_i1.p1 TRINITY_DN20103_c0_g1~~TRINITY_DN20103_c0_g1_i1.p1  ORF type:complete len:653 (+),score=176.06 TRINITY_DN20103_c0_g1_i1:72-2030(+)
MSSVREGKPSSHLQGLQTSLLSAQAQHKKEILEYQSRLSKLSKQHSITEQKLKEYAAEVKRLRTIAESQEREFSVAKKQVDALNTENTSLQSRLHESQHLIKRLEFKFSGGSSQWLLEKNASLSDIVELMKDEIDQGKDVIRQQNEQLDHFRREVDVLTTALSLRSEEFGNHGDLKTVLLYDLAKAKEEISCLASDNGAKSSRIIELEQFCESLQIQLEQLVEKMKQSIQENDELRAKLQESESSKEKLMHELQDQQAERKLMLTYIREEIQQGSSTKELLLRLTNEQSEREKYLQMELENSKKHVEKLEKDLEGYREATKSISSLEKDLAVEREKKSRVESQLRDAQYLLNKGSSDVATLTSELDGLTEISETLRLELAQCRRELEEKKKSHQELFRKDEILQNELSMLRSLKEQNASELATKIHALSQELQKAVEEKEKYVRLAKEALARSQSADSLLEKLHLEHAQLRDQVETLIKSKGTLQQTLLEQIASLKNQLDVTSEANRQTEVSNQQLQEENSRLIALYDEERKKGKDKRAAWAEAITFDRSNSTNSSRISGQDSDKVTDARNIANTGAAFKHSSRVTFDPSLAFRSKGASSSPAEQRPRRQKTIFALPDSVLDQSSQSLRSGHTSTSFPTLIEQARQYDDSDE